jgi:negative regulator of flagellin synthesis FlgM
MKIAGGSTLSGPAAVGRVAETAAVDAAAAATPRVAKPQAEGAALQSAALQPALDALRALPDFDHAKVAALRDALAKGEVAFDPARLAGLIQRFHGGDR